MKAEDSGTGARGGGGGGGGGRKVAGYNAERFSLLSSLRIHGAGFNWMDTIAWCLIN